MTVVLQFILSKWGFIVCLSLVGISSLTCIVLSLFKFQLKKALRIFYFLVLTGISLISLASSLAFNTAPFRSLLILGGGLIAISPMSFACERVKDAKELVRQIDREISSQGVESTAISVENVKPKQADKVTKIALSQKIEEKPKKNELDFSHVKNILERLDYYSLSTGDKKTVNDLENSLTLAEKGDCTSENKTRINDGLGALLKIMSKYGV